jgi:hypothetical protein
LNHPVQASVLLIYTERPVRSIAVDLTGLSAPFLPALNQFSKQQPQNLFLTQSLLYPSFINRGIIGLNVKSNTILASLKHLLEENREGHHYEIGVGKDFLTQLTIKGEKTH